METKTYSGTFNTEVLGENLYDAFPNLAAAHKASGYTTPPITFFLSETSLTVLMPDGTNWDKVDAVIAAYSPTSESQASQFRDKVILMAQSAAGVALKDLTTVQIKALITYMLYRMGGIDPATMTVKPLSDW